MSTVPVALLLVLMSPSVPAATQLDITDTQFALNARPTFLLGISYYGGLDASDETVDRDLARIKESGFNWIRLWATWHSGPGRPHSRAATRFQATARGRKLAASSNKPCKGFTL